MIAVNLLNWRREARKRQLKRWLGLSGTLLALLAVALLLWWRMLAETTQRRQSQLTLWQQATQQAQQLHQRYEEAQKQHQALRKQAALHQQAHQRLAQWQAFILQLESNVPDDAWLSSLMHQQGNVRLEGLSLQPEAARLLRRRLSASALFQPWRPGALKKSANGPYRFTLASGKAEDGDGQ
ncbi:PilN domain-containing protein [Erwinia sp. PK3-005]|uniref:PilN domain-containing protein n=1 Tax=Mixta hanseatica TaxID=2872648 RepID=A0ABY4R819_9GAMM|nr:PilN domain-containing protein [Mixta hanseatica]UQY44448.1 PilN domain-containing protein [Mixta hanseatica]